MNQEVLVFVPQETRFFRLMMASVILVTHVSWFVDHHTATTIVGWAVIAHLVFFYGSPLHTIRAVVRTSDSAAIHRPKLTMRFVNTTF